MKVQQCHEDLLTETEASAIDLWKLSSDLDSEQELDDPVEDFDSMICDGEGEEKIW